MTKIQSLRTENNNASDLLTKSPFTVPLIGTKEIYVDVDDDGLISMVFECSEMKEGSQFVWSKNYKEMIDTSRLTIVNERGK